MFEVSLETGQGQEIENPEFNLTVTITATYSDEDLQGMAFGRPTLLGILWLNDASGQWEALPTKLDPAFRSLTAQVKHFSIFAVGVLQTTTPTATPTAAPLSRATATPTDISTPRPIPTIPFLQEWTVLYPQEGDVIQTTTVMAEVQLITTTEPEIQIDGRFPDSITMIQPGRVRHTFFDIPQGEHTLVAVGPNQQVRITFATEIVPPPPKGNLTFNYSFEGGFFPPEGWDIAADFTDTEFFSWTSAARSGQLSLSIGDIFGRSGFDFISGFTSDHPSWVSELMPVSGTGPYTVRYGADGPTAAQMETRACWRSTSSIPIYASFKARARSLPAAPAPTPL